MNNQFINSVVTVMTAIIGLAIVAVIVSNRANTSGVIKSTGAAFSESIGAAVSPVTGGSGSGLRPTSFSFTGGPVTDNAIY